MKWRSSCRREGRREGPSVTGGSCCLCSGVLTGSRHPRGRSLAVCERANALGSHRLSGGRVPALDEDGQGCERPAERREGAHMPYLPSGLATPLLHPSTASLRSSHAHPPPHIRDSCTQDSCSLRCCTRGGGGGGGGGHAMSALVTAEGDIFRRECSQAPCRKAAALGCSWSLYLERRPNNELS